MCIFDHIFGNKIKSSTLQNHLISGQMMAIAATIMAVAAFILLTLAYWWMIIDKFSQSGLKKIKSFYFNFIFIFQSCFLVWVFNNILFDDCVICGSIKLLYGELMMVNSQ